MNDKKKKSKRIVLITVFILIYATIIAVNNYRLTDTQKMEKFFYDNRQHFDTVAKRLSMHKKIITIENAAYSVGRDKKANSYPDEFADIAESLTTIFSSGKFLEITKYNEFNFNERNIYYVEFRINNFFVMINEPSKIVYTTKDKETFANILSGDIDAEISYGVIELDTNWYLVVRQR